MDNQKIGQYIAKKRKEKGLTQKELAQKLNITNKAVSKWENAASLPDISLLKDLAKALDITVDELLDGQDHNKQHQSLLHNYQKITISSSIQLAYLKEQYYQRKIISMILFVWGWLFIFAGISFYLLDRYLNHHLKLFSVIVMTVGVILLLIPVIIYLYKKFIIKDYDIQYLLQEDRLSYIINNQEIIYLYHDIDKIWELGDYAILKCGRTILYLNSADYHLIENHLVNATWQHCSNEDKIKYWIKAITWIVLIVAAVLELGYQIVMKRVGFEYIFDQMEMMMILLMIISSVLLIVIKKIKLNRSKGLLMVLTVLLILVATWIFGDMISNNKTYYSLSPNLSSQLVLKQNKQTGQVRDLHYTFLCFARVNESFIADRNSLNTMWLNQDNNLVTYEFNGQKQVYVATYGDRGSGYSYYYVAPSLSGNWRNLYDEDKTYNLSVTNGTINVSSEGSYDSFIPDQIDQFGTTAIVLNENDQPRFVIALNQNCQINDNGLIGSGGTIMLVDLSNNCSVELFCTTDKGNETIAGNTTTIRESDLSYINEMHELVNNQKAYDSLKSGDRYYKIETTSADYFEITRLAYQQQYFENPSDGIDVDEQIQTITVLNGNQDEFFVQVNASGIFTSGNESEETGLEVYYRILKAPGGYLAKSFSSTSDGSIGLVALESPLVKDVSQDQAYHFVSH